MVIEDSLLMKGVIVTAMRMICVFKIMVITFILAVFIDLCRIFFLLFRYGSLLITDQSFSLYRDSIIWKGP